MKIVVSCSPSALKVQHQLINLLNEEFLTETLQDVSSSVQQQQGRKIPKVGGDGESPERIIPEVFVQKNEKISFSGDVPLLKMPCAALQRPTAGCPAVCFHRSALITPRLCQKQHDTAFQAAPHTVSEPALNNSSPTSLI